jgi:GTP-binding protein
LARTSKTPGRTQQIVIFDLDEQRRIIDLPGYGYAKVSRSLIEHWQAVMQDYFEQRKCLKGVVLVMDIRHPLKPYDTQMLAWCQANDLPCHVLLTKSDKLKRGPAQATLLKVKKEMPGKGSVQVFSAKNHQGLDQLVAHLSDWYGLTQNKPGQDSA